MAEFVIIIDSVRAEVPQREEGCFNFQRQWLGQFGVGLACLRRTQEPRASDKMEHPIESCPWVETQGLGHENTPKF